MLGSKHEDGVLDRLERRVGATIRAAAAIHESFWPRLVVTVDPPVGRWTRDPICPCSSACSTRARPVPPVAPNMSRFMESLLVFWAALLARTLRVSSHQFTKVWCGVVQEYYSALAKQSYVPLWQFWTAPELIFKRQPGRVGCRLLRLLSGFGRRAWPEPS